jgi:hypothetical protein
MGLIVLLIPGSRTPSRRIPGALTTTLDIVDHAVLARPLAITP